MFHIAISKPEKEGGIMDERVVIFIDGSNLYHGMKEILGKVNLDYERFARKLCGQRKLLRVYYYIPLVSRQETEEQFRSQQRFLTYLQDIPYFHIKYGRLARQGELLVEKVIDVQIAVDMVVYGARNFYDTAILVSGDGDFAPAIESVKELGKNVECAFFPEQTSVIIRQLSDVYIPLNDEFLKECRHHKEEPEYFPSRKDYPENPSDD